jgi:OOP family OmpA-OmpF porin
VFAQHPINNMTSTHRTLRPWPLAVTAVVFTCSAQAQMASGTTTNNRNLDTRPYSSASTGPRQMYSSESFSVIPYSTNGYIGLNIGQSDWSIPCTGGGFGCSESKTAHNIHTGGMFNQHVGAELG